MYLSGTLLLLFLFLLLLLAILLPHLYFLMSHKISLNPLNRHHKSATSHNKFLTHMTHKLSIITSRKQEDSYKTKEPHKIYNPVNICEFLINEEVQIINFEDKRGSEREKRRGCAFDDI